MRRTRGGRREGRTLAQVNSWQTAWHPPRRRWDSIKVSRWCGGKAKPRGTWPGGGGHRRVNPLSRKEGERATGVTGVIASSPTTKIFYRVPLSAHPEHKSGRQRHESRRRCRRRWEFRAGSLIQSRLLYHGEPPFRATDRAIGKGVFFQFHVTTGPSLCIKVVVLHTSYNSTIGFKLI